MLAIGLLATTLKICPCPHCEWDGHYFVRVSGVPTRLTCDRCVGKGFVTAVGWLRILAGGRVAEPAFMTVFTFCQDVDPRWPSFTEEFVDTLRESGGDVRVFWPSPPTMTFSTSGLHAAAQIGGVLAVALFSPLWRCAACRRRPHRRTSTPKCPACGGSGTLSSYRRWIPGTWRSALRRGGAFAITGIIVSVLLYLAAQIPYKPCPGCPAVREQNRQSGDVIIGCPRCGDVGRIGLWNSLFLSDH